MPTAAERDLWERENPIQALPRPPLGINVAFASLPDPPTPERVRLGRWLFFDTRLSRDNTLSCGSCHQPDTAFARPSPIARASGQGVSTRKVPTIINLTNPRPPTFFKGVPAAFFWDGRATTLQAQALEPIANPGEMANSHEDMVDTLSRVPGYAPYFSEAFGDARITKERVGQAIADYERTRMSGNSAFDRWRVAGDDAAVSSQVKQGFVLFTGKALCNRCHNGPLFTDGTFHNLGIGWDPATQTFTDEGRHLVTQGKLFARAGDADRGAFKTPTLRDITRRAPYMHDGSIRTLREVVEFYNRGTNANPYLDVRIPPQPLGLTNAEIDAVVRFLESLDGEGWQDRAPSRFPR
jgi:cytochrome c peroxidase